MKFVALAVLQAGIRQKDMEMKEALERGSETTLEVIRKQRHDLANDVRKIIFNAEMKS